MTLNEAVALYGTIIIPQWHAQVYNNNYKLESRRYIGCKAKLVDWIFELIQKETRDIHSFCDIFAGTGVVANRAFALYDKVIVNDFLYSNNIIYKAFFQDSPWNEDKVKKYLTGTILLIRQLFLITISQQTMEISFLICLRLVI